MSPADQASDQAVEFGPFRLLPGRRLLTCGGTPVHLGDRAFEILLILVEWAPNVVSKKALLERAWQGQLVEEVNLRFQMGALRKALGEGNRYISTINGRGYCFVAPVVRFAAVPGATASAATNLPQPLTNIVARAGEMAELREKLRHDRLVTLVGPGGVGKTRLAVELGWCVLGDFPAGVWRVDLAPVNAPDAVASATAAALGIALPAEQQGAETIAAAMDRRPSLLIFDNCEHLTGAVAALVTGLLEKVPALSVLATSQEVLGLQAENAYRLHPLAVPPAGAGAVDLFVRRAQMADRLFVLDRRNEAGVAEICRRLDGVPLALEMAAARIHLLGVEGLRAGLDARLKLLKGAPHGGVAMRHASLQAMVEWSHGLLDPLDQRLFRRLAVFPASFTLDAAVAVDDDIDRWVIVDSLGRLVDKSLVAIESREPVRYRLLETLRLFAAEQLRAAGEGDEVSSRHARHVLAMVEEAYIAWEAMPDPAWAARYRPDIDDLRTALDWALAAPERRELALALGGWGMRFFMAFALTADGKRYVDRLALLIDRDTPAEVEARVFGQAAGLLVRSRVPAGLIYAQRAADLYRQLGDRPGLGVILAGIGIYRAAQQRYEEAFAAFHEAWELLADTKFKKRQLVVLIGLGNTTSASGDYEAARRYYNQALDIARVTGSVFAPGISLGLAVNEYVAGNVDRAIEIGQEAIDRVRSSQTRRDFEGLTANQALYLLTRGDVEAARFFAEEAFTSARAAHYPRIGGLMVWAALAAFEGRLTEAARLIGAVDADLAQKDEPVDKSDRWIYDELMRRLDVGLAPADLAALKAAGARWTIAEAIEFVSSRLLTPPHRP